MKIVVSIFDQTFRMNIIIFLQIQINLPFSGNIRKKNCLNFFSKKLYFIKISISILIYVHPKEKKSKLFWHFKKINECILLNKKFMRNYPIKFWTTKYSNKISKKFKFDYLSFLLFLKINHTNRMKKGDFGFWEFSAVFAILL